MISSIVWLYLYKIGEINPDKAPWKIYLPIVFIEIVVYLKLFPKILDFIDKVMNNKVEGE
jgi:hypothetical protein